MRRFLGQLSSSKTGVTTVEYALIAGLLAVATIVGAGLISPSVFATLKAASEATPVD